MANKWQIKLDVNLIEKETITRLLSAEVSRLRDVLELTADADEYDDITEQIHSLEQLRDQVNLSWIEREVEIHKGSYPTREMKRKWHSGEGL
jgi:hypothetical protein